jgi:hypothetical protein
MHFVFFPLAFVAAPVAPDVLAGSFQVVVDEVALEGGPFGSYEFSVAVFLSLDVGSYVFGSVWPCLESLPLLGIPNPLPLITGAILMSIYPVPVSLIINPLSFVDITFLMDQPPISLSFVILPVPLIYRPIIPYLLAFPMPLPIPPLPVIYRLIHLKRSPLGIFSHLLLLRFSEWVFRIIKLAELVECQSC